MKDAYNCRADNGSGESKNDKYDYLKDLSIVRLYALLQQESFLGGDGSFDYELVRRIVDILEEREPSFEDLDVGASLERFKAGVIPEPEKDIDAASRPIYPGKEMMPAGRAGKRRLPGRFPIALAAAILAIMLGGTAIANAVGFEVWEYVISLSKETFRIGTGMEISGEPGAEATTEGEAAIRLVEPGVYGTFEEAMQALDINILVPGWIPDRFKLTRIETTETPLHKGVVALYQAGGEVLMYSADIYNSGNASSAHEMDEGSGEEIIINDIKHYFMTNAGQTCVVWIRDGCVYSISGNVTKDELVKMLNSIYEEKTNSNYLPFSKK